MKILVIIPARGGSKGIPRKNVRLINNRPLISYAVKNALGLELIDDVIVSTDDEEIADIAVLYGAKVIMRPAKLGDDVVTLDPVIYHAVCAYEQDNGKVDIVITMQPTSPLLRAKTLKKAIQSFLQAEMDTMISAANRPHLAWKMEEGQYVPLYEQRLNRQYLPKHLMETGAFVISRRDCVTETSRIGEKVNLFEVPEEESVDIDDYADWLVCEMQLKKKRIMIRVEGYPEIGLGHIYRGILLANNLMEHDVLIVLSSKSQLGISKIEEHFLKYKVVENQDEFIELLKQWQPNVLVNDILDTTEEYMQGSRPFVDRIVNFEDMGRGNHMADAVVNALYDKSTVDGKYYWGYRYYCLRDEFLITRPKEFSENVKKILVLFGGTDPGHYTEKVFRVIDSLPYEDIDYQFILGLGYDRDNMFMKMVSKSQKNIRVVKDVKVLSKYMAEADIAISSQGRTMYELAAMRVPTIILAQNEREIAHEFGYMKNGFINLGNGKDVEEDTIRETLLWLIHTPYVRRQMRRNMERLKLTGGVNRIKDIILGTEN